MRDASVNLIADSNAIKVLKNDILSRYHEYVKSENRRITDSFILLTRECYDKLEPMDKYHCKEICDKEFYIAEFGHFKRRARIYRFLDKIGMKSPLYDRIDEVYIEPF